MDEGAAVSHPSRVRGLKFTVAVLMPTTSASHPSRVRGLKLMIRHAMSWSSASHPSRVRGLKFLKHLIVKIDE